MPKHVEYITESEFEKVLRIVEEDDPDAFPPTFGLLLRTFWATGCRPAELLGRKGRDGRPGTGEQPRISRVKDHHGLRAEDIRPDHRLYIEGKNTAPNNNGRLKPRVVLCADVDTWQALRDRAQGYEDKTRNFFVPGSSNGMSMIRRYVEKLQDRLEGRLSGFTLRWMRHSHAIYSIQNGVDLVSLQRQLGHEHLTTTANYLKYAGLDDEPYLQAFGERAPREARHQCPSCGFEWSQDADTGRLTWEARMGRAMRRTG